MTRRRTVLNGRGKRCFHLGLLFFFFSLPRLQADDIYWLGASNFWNTATNWDLSVAPLTTNYSVYIDGGLGSPSYVKLNVNANIGNLFIDSGDTLEITSGKALTLDGTAGGIITNAGEIILTTVASVTTWLKIKDQVVLSGGGVITMGNNTANRIEGVSGSTNVFINEDNLIQGSGAIGNNLMKLINRGTINANQSSTMTLDPDAQGVINSGTIAASQGGTLVLNTGTYTNYEGITDGLILSSNSVLRLQNVTVEGGMLQVMGTGSVSLTSSTITGGTIQNSDAGTIRATTGSSTLGGSIINPSGGQIIINDGRTLILNSDGPITNAGSIQINASSANTYLTFAQDTTLTGGGTLDLSKDTRNIIKGTNSSLILINQDNTIQGAGDVGNNLLNLVNRGAIIADKTNNLTVNPTSWAINSGSIIATNNSVLTLTGAAYTNYEGSTLGRIGADMGAIKITSSTVEGGLITISGASTVELNNATLNNIVLTNSSAGEIRIVSSSSTINGGIDNLAGGRIILNSDLADNGVFHNGGQVDINDFRTLTLNLTAPLTNSGTINLNANSGTATLALDNDLTLTGGGTLNLGNDAGNRITANSSTYYLINEDNTIQGSGTLGNNIMGLVNRGTIAANQSVLLTVDPNSLAMINSGTMRADQGRTLVLNAGDYTNFEGSTLGLLQASHGTLDLNSANIYGGYVQIVGTGTLDLASSLVTDGTLENSSQGTINISANSTLGGTIINSAGGQIIVGNGKTLTLDTPLTVTNEGTMSFEATTLSTVFMLAQNTTLAGGGIISLGNDSQNNISGSSSSIWLINEDNTIMGSGFLDIALTNNGTVLANSSVGLNLSSQNKVNNGSFQASTGGTLVVSVNVSGTGTWQADGGKIQLNSGSSVTTTGNITVANSGELELNTATMYGAHLIMDSTGILDVNGGASKLSLSGDVTFEMTTEANWDWAANSDLEMTGGIGATTNNWEPWVSLEIGGMDDGMVSSGFTNNFSLQELVLGADAHIYLQDLIDNGNQGGLAGSSEAIYVNTLTFTDSSGQLNKNGLNLYYNTLNGDPSQIIDQEVIPEPSTLFLGLTGLWLIAQTLKRRAHQGNSASNR